MSAPATPPSVAAAAATASSSTANGNSTGGSNSIAIRTSPLQRVSGGAYAPSEPVSMFSAAAQADLFRALQKDDYMLGRWREEWAELSTSLLGGSLAARVEPELSFLCRAAYFATTSLRGKPTLGEEYVDVQQVAPVRVYEQFRRERAERRQHARTQRALQQQQQPHQQALPSQQQPLASSASSAAAVAAESLTASVPAVQAGAPAASFSIPAAASASAAVPSSTLQLLPSQIIHTSPAPGRVPLAAPLFTWARYNRFELPSARRRFALFFIQVCAPYLHERLLQRQHGGGRRRWLQFDVTAEQQQVQAQEREQREQAERARRFEANDMPLVQLEPGAAGDGENGDSSNSHGGVLRRLRNSIRLSSWSPFSPHTRLRLKLFWNRLVSLLLFHNSSSSESAQQLSNQLQRLHLAFFYLAGRYLEVSKRLSGIQYVQLRKLEVPRPGYELFGVLLLIQVVVGLGRVLRDTVRALRAPAAEDGEDDAASSAAIASVYSLDGVNEGAIGSGAGVSASGLYSLSAGERLEEAEEAREVHVREASSSSRAHQQQQQHRPQPAAAAAAAASSGPRIHTIHDQSHSSDAEEEEEEEEEEEDDANRPDCTLCLCPREHTTATECGHLFCWECISAAVSAKPECPLCRQPCALNLLLLLPQYK